MTVPAQLEHAPQTPSHGRILVTADRTLVGEAIRMALSSRGLQSAFLLLPTTQDELHLLVRWVATYAPDVGVVICEESEAAFVRRSATVVAQVPLPWLVLTASTDPRRWGELLAAGAIGILPMTSSLRDLTSAIDQVTHGTPVMSEHVKRRAVEMWHLHTMSQRQLNLRMRQLTPRERSILDDLSEGHSVTDIAEDSGVAVLTVRTQVKSILRKLGVTSQLAAVAYSRAARELHDSAAHRLSAE